MRTGLYFGSFNPIHIGHLIVANTMIETAGFDEVWMVISPQNPFKKPEELAPESDRKAMVDIALQDHPEISSCDVEFSMSRPSYTIDTLLKLQEMHPDREFAIIMGTDNLVHFHKWKRYEDILKTVSLHVYDRRTEINIPERFKNHKSIHSYNFPLVDVSSTMLRNKSGADESIRYWVLSSVEAYIEDHRLYRIPSSDD
ncbi:MAG: nicotinate-nucleotide adenylyltransferase [Bacteroidetes bacterium]|nr:nicotinate-nucleotide adenylyltransferase [Bacteroidota bacterium]